MVFSSIVFLYLFLPVTLAGYYILGKKYKNLFLFISSLLFFAWGGVSYSLLLIFSIIFNYIIGKRISKNNGSKKFLIIGIVINLLLLFVFKYLNFIIENLNVFFVSIQIPVINNPPIILPIGISFYTFQAMSYLIDVYYKKTESQKSLINLGLYISLFPQLIAGPIVRYHDIDKQINNRKTDFTKFSSGVIRFCLGLGKKVLIANNLALVADKVFVLPVEDQTTLYTWLGIMAYTFQIYYDFSGYSDMAIGLGRMFGFEILENFNFPYISKSIKEFWRRWHISLSNWFRDYLYIPMGGNRKGSKRTYTNLLIVFVVTGFWHGASWNFLIWGLIHGFFLIIERFSFNKFLEKLPSFFQYLYTITIVIVAWVFFRAETLKYAINYISVMFFPGNNKPDSFFMHQLMNKETIIVFIIAVLGSFNIFILIYKYLKELIHIKLNKYYNILKLSKTVIYAGFVIIIMFLSTIYLISGTYNPFIYYRF